MITTIKYCILKFEYNFHCISIPTKLSVYFVGDYNVQKNPSLTLIISLTTTIQSFHPISFKHPLLHYTPESHTWFLLFRFPKQTLYSFLLNYMQCYMTHIYYLLCYDYVNNIWWRVAYMKLTTESSAPLYSYPLSHQIFSTPPCSHKPSWHKTPNFTPTQNGRNNVSFIWVLNWMVTSTVWTYPALFSMIMVLLKFRQGLTYLKPDLRQSDSGTSQAMWQNTNCSRLFHKDCSKSILHSPTILWIHISWEAWNAE